MSADFLKRISEGTVLFDGGMGSMLIAAGLGEREIPEQWNIEQPRKMIDIHTAYLVAGAEVVQTNTFGGSPIKLAASEAGRGLDPSEVNRKAVELLKKAADDFNAIEREIDRSGIERKRFIAGDVGPTGEFFPPMGRLTAENAFEAFKVQAAALENGGVDLFLVETMYDLREAVEALRAIKKVSSRPVGVLMTFDRKPRGFFTLVGDTPAKAAEVLMGEGADMIGANCTLQSDAAADLAAELRAATDLPVIIQPNAGRPEMVDGRAVYRQTPEEFADDMKGAIANGANGVGGCCGTTPDFIRALREVIDGTV
ncbi:MAG TPA: homocysteine S-methyltransferase family protein [Candidatus Krumholzibacterium sp.]|nr:homocysteine S-methyltransferase family protein [Candidatus Krumholzibacterium sp.]